MQLHIMVADGDEIIRRELKALLGREGYDVDAVSDGITAIKHFRRYEYHLVILDFLLPELDGKSVIRQLRKMSTTPFILMSSLHDEEDILMAFKLGAEDYIRKPFYPTELLARIKAVLRRNDVGQAAPIRNLAFDGLYIDTNTRNVFVNDKMISLTPKEYELLTKMAGNPNQAFSREALLNDIWGSDYYGTDRTVDTHIKTLREALRPRHYYIATVRGLGYKFDEFGIK
ncbi:MAG TPA: DNA-binding response regulator [Clostridiales bacterium]|nr:DNA-binding response regulator [Clostridiales bacterium]